MDKPKSLLLVGEIYHSIVGAAESRAQLYVDAQSRELLVVESVSILDRYPRYSGTGPGTYQHMTLGEFVAKCPSRYRDTAIQLATKALGQTRDRRHPAKTPSSSPTWQTASAFCTSRATMTR